MRLQKRLLSLVVVIAFILASLAGLNFGNTHPSFHARSASPMISGAQLSNTTYDNVTFTGNATHDFPAGALLYSNAVDPWGASNNVVNLFGTWNKTTLFLAVNGVAIGSGNNFMFAISNHTKWGTENLSSTSLSNFDRNILFSTPMNFIFFVSSSSPTKVYALQVLSYPNSSSTVFTNITPDIYNNISSNGNFEVALNFSLLFPAFPAGANVSLYASIFGGSGAYVGPTIPSGQSYDVTYESPALTSHDVYGGAYVLENTFYTLHLDPHNLGYPEAGILPSYMAGFTFHSVKFTGNVAADFASGEKALMNTNTMYGGSNLLNAEYLTWNYTTLFIGINGTASNNWIYVFLGNGTSSGYGAYNISNFSSPFSSLDRDILLTSPVNFVFAVYYGSNNVPSKAYFVKIISNTSASNTSIATLNISSSVEYMSNANNLEISVPFSVLYNFSSSWPVFRPYSSISLVTAIVGNSGGSVGPTMPSGQGYAYTGYYNKNHTIGAYDLLNTFFTEQLDPYGDGVPALQINPTYTYGKTYHTVKFTGNVTNDFVSTEIIGNNTAEPYGSGDTLSDLYATWNYTTLFVGTKDVLQSGAFGPNYLMVAISNDTMTGSVNLSATNVQNLTRNIIFGTYVNYIFATNSVLSNGTLYEVVPSQTNSTYTYLRPVATFPLASNGIEFYINFSQLYPNQPSEAGSAAIPIGAQFSIAALIYGGSGAYVGPTIPSGQNYSASTGYDHISAFATRSLDQNKDGYAEPGIIPGYVPVEFSGAPINLNIIFNDHQPLYSPIGYNYWLLPWTAVHLEEYAEQALIIKMFPTVNITYSLSGSLLYQIEAIAHGNYNNSYIMAAEIPVSQWNNSLYTEITQYHDFFLFSFAPQYQWNTTTVRDVLEYDLAFNTPLWVYSAGTNASKLYDQLFTLEQTGVTLNNTQLTDALVEYFLWTVSYPIISGMLGRQYVNSTLLELYNQSSFSISEIREITAFYPYEANLTISTFKSVMELNSTNTGNVEILTTPFDHPIQPLLLLNNWTGAAGDQIVKGVWSTDELAQLNIGKQIYYSAFGQYPVGLWSPEQAVSGAIVPFLNETGYEWTSSADSTLAETGIAVPSASQATAQEMENLYQPYRVVQNNTSVVMVFRDSTLSNDWGFNYGRMAATGGNWAPVASFIDYLRNVYTTVPRSDHANITVTVALDGENWMFMNPFPYDAVPFLIDLYTGLAQNSSWLHTVTMQQYLLTHHTMPTLTNLPIGSWNPQPTAPGISEYLGQWAGHEPQDASWQQLALVRSLVVAYGNTHGLVQPMNLTAIEAANSYPFLGMWNSSTAQERYDRAWMDIYGAEGSDIYFSFDPADQSLTAQNAIVFEYILRYDLSNALQVLGIPLTPFLAANWTPPVPPTVYGYNTSITPPLTGNLYTTESFNGYTAFSVNNNFAWKGASEYTANGPAGAQGISRVYYAYDANNLYFAIQVNGPTRQYAAPNSYTAAPLELQIYFSPVNPGQGDLQGLSIANAVFAYPSGQPTGYAATTMVTIEGSSVTPSGSGNIAIYDSGQNGNWVYNQSLPNAYVGNVIEVEVPLSALGMIPGNSITFSVATVNASTSATYYAGPLYLSIPSSIAKLTLISTIHNTYPDNGPGNYTYPLLSADYPNGSVDMEWVNVSVNSFLVQFNFTFGALSNPFGGGYGFSQPMIDIYIHETNGSAGNTAMLPGPNANVTPAFAWQWVIQADGFAANAYIESYTGQIYTSSLLITSNLTTKTVSVEAPLSLIGTNIAHYGYVIVAGFQDGYGTNGWDYVNIGKASDYQGGGAGGPNAPYIYSYIAPAAVNSSSPLTQQKVLSSYTSKSLAALPGIYLPLIVKKVTTSVSTLPTYSAVGYNSQKSEYMAFYLVNGTVYWSSSADGTVWASPLALFRPSGSVTSMNFYSTGTSTYLLVSTPSGYTVVNLTAGVSFSNVSAPALVKSASLTVSGGNYFVFLSTATTIYAMNSAGKQIGTMSAVSDNISAYTSNGTWIVYSGGGDIYLDAVTLTFSSATFSGATTLIAVQAGNSTGQLSLTVNSFSQVAVAYVLINSTGSNIMLAYGKPGNLTTRAITSDGLDSSPSAIMMVSGNTTSLLIAFTNSASAGNVFFIPTPVASFTYTAPIIIPSPLPIKVSKPLSSILGYVLIALAAVIIVAGIAAYVLVSRRKKGN